jgi:ATP-dependent Clp protease ATP-binding subunit ClpE
MEEILPTIVSYYEDFHGVEYSDEFLNNIINYCERYIPNKFYPDKAIDVIDHCGAQAKVNFWHITPSIKAIQVKTVEAALDPEKDHSELLEKLNASLEKWTEGVNSKTPVVKLNHLKDFFDKKKNPLSNKKTVERLFACLSKSLVGQGELLNKLKERIILSSLGLKKVDNFSSPDCYAISGPQFAGKSYFVDLLKDSLQKRGVNVLSYSGVHFADNFAPHKIASSQGTNTSICEKIAISPNSVLIIDDFHKIDNSAIPIFNQIFKHGNFQMTNGDIADFSNCKIFLTCALSNSQSSMGFQALEKTKENLLIHPDILSQIDDYFILKELKDKDLRRLLWMKLKRLKNRLKDNGIELSFSFDYIFDTVNQIQKEKNKTEALSKKILSEITPHISDSILRGEETIELCVEKERV